MNGMKTRAGGGTGHERQKRTDPVFRSPRGRRRILWLTGGVALVGTVLVAFLARGHRPGASSSDEPTTSVRPAVAPAEGLSGGSSPLPPSVFRAVVHRDDIPTAELEPELSAMVDLACAKTKAFEAEGRSSEVALEHAFNATGQHRRVLMDRYSEDHVLRFAAPDLGAEVSALVGSPPRACAAIIAVWAAQRWPESADHGFLHEMLAHRIRSPKRVADVRSRAA